MQNYLEDKTDRDRRRALQAKEVTWAMCLFEQCQVGYKVCGKEYLRDQNQAVKVV